MDLDQVRATLAQPVERQDASADSEQAESRYGENESPLVRTVGDAAHTLVEQLGSDDGFRFGLAAIDLLVRGLRPRELCVLTGFAHAGKTQLVLTAILANPDKRVLFLSLDDPSEMLLLKLCSMQHGVAGDELERLIRAGDGAELIQQTIDSFPNLLLVDDSLGTRRLNGVIAEATDHWQAEPDIVIIDYLELLADVSGDTVDDGVKAVAKRLKRKAKGYGFPLLVLHQNTRSRGAPGEPITMLSMAHGGEQEGTVVIGVRRKRDNESLEYHQRMAEQDTITVHVVKNKRPPGKKTAIEGEDLFMDPDTGLIRPMREGDWRLGQKRPKPTVVESAKDAVAMARRSRELV